MPLLIRLCKKYAFPVALLFGIALFLSTEIGFEQIKVLEGYSTQQGYSTLPTLPLDSWQYSLCSATPEVLKSICEPIYSQNNPAYFRK